MITVSSPLFLAAGGALAVAAIALHLLVRRPPPLQPLPTARFLTPAAHTRIQLQSRPVDVPLLVVRIMMAFTLGALFAGLSWHPDRSGVTHVVLVDGGADPTSSWSDVQARAQSVWEALPAEDRPQILVYGVEGSPRLVRPEALDQLDRGASPRPLSVGLQELRGFVSSIGQASVDVTWVTRATWDDWSPGMGLTRAELWPGQIRLAAVEPVPAEEAGATTNTPATPVAHVMGADADDPLPRALRAVGFEVITPAETATPSGEGTVVFLPAGATPGPAGSSPGSATPAAAAPSSEETGRTGTHWVTWGASSGAAWTVATAGGGRADAATGIVLPDEHVLDVQLSHGPGSPAEGAHLLALFSDATPAAAARRMGRDCHIHSAAALDDPALVADPDFPLYLEVLARGCASDGGAVPLDRGAIDALVRPDLPERITAAELGLPGRSLTRLLALLMLLLVAAEFALTRRRAR